MGYYSPTIWNNLLNSDCSAWDSIKDEDVINEIKAVDLGNITPLEALNLLSKYQDMLINRWKG